MLIANHWTQSIREIVGAEAALPPGTSPWKQITPALVVYPRTASEVGRVLRFAAEEGLGVIPRGRGTKVGWGEAPTRADIVLSLESLDGLVAHEPGDMTVTTEAGMGVSELQTEVTATGARLDLDPPFLGAATLGGLIASQSTGPVHVRISDLILGMEIALADGSLVRTGSRVVKSVAGFDLHKALVGSRGTLGVITEMTWRLRPSPPASRYLTAEVAPGEAADRLAALRESEVRPAWTLLENGRWEGFPPRRVKESVLVHLVCEGEAEAVDAHLEKASEILGAGGNGTSGR
ncbi:MAG: FAD-binding oxidoreductase, partial [Planctomycetota bacterium]|nr:FAD-binding oxidoreductase [Planctomycetota bacterium]